MKHELRIGGDVFARSGHTYIMGILNVTPDHLNRHHTMENYSGAKEAIAKNQDSSGTCVLNYENEYTRDFGLNRCPASVVFFSSKRVLEEGIYCEGDTIPDEVEGVKPNITISFAGDNAIGNNIQNVSISSFKAILSK